MGACYALFGAQSLHLCREGKEHHHQLCHRVHGVAEVEDQPSGVADAFVKDEHLPVLFCPLRQVVHVRHGRDGSVEPPPHDGVILVRTR
jgi:hypothetical protein